jgi:hypothetical protein
MFGWMVEAVYGVDNRTVRSGTRDAIVREFADGGIVWRPNPGECMEQDAFKVFVKEINAASGLEWVRRLVKRTGASE